MQRIGSRERKLIKMLGKTRRKSCCGFAMPVGRRCGGESWNQSSLENVDAINLERGQLKEKKRERERGRG